MSPLEIVAIILAGMGAGTINTIVGSGTLISFPTLLFLGFPPVAANVTNSLGLVASGVTGAVGYRRELRQSAEILKMVLSATISGAIVGAVLLLWLPPAAFKTIVPVLIFLALLLVIFGGRLNAWARAHSIGGEVGELPTGRTRLWLWLGVFGGGVYGGYFGAAQGVLLMGLMTVLLGLPIQQLNAIKNVLAPVANLVASVVFVAIALDQVHWVAAGLLAIGSAMGGFIGAHVGRRLPPNVLRGVIVVVGVLAILRMTVFAG